jgi:hypothetical protein
LADEKGVGLEELVRAYFARQGFFALRGVLLRFEEEQVTDIDVWLYGRQSASVRTRIIVDVKNRRSPKAFERILWTRGIQLALGCDRAIVATTETNPKVTRFAEQQKVGLLTKGFLERLQKGIDTTDRLTSEQFSENIKQYQAHKQDGDWLKQISDAKSAAVSLPGYPAFNKSMAAFRFFAERAETRPQHREQTIRAAYFTAALACIALDAALERVLYEDSGSRFKAITNGVTYGDAGDSKVQKSIDTVLAVISSGMENGRVVSSQAKRALEKLFQSVRADIIAEYFVREHNAATLFGVAKELDDRAHSADSASILSLSTEAKSIIGVFADFVEAKRGMLLNQGIDQSRKTHPTGADEPAVKSRSEAENTADAPTDTPAPDDTSAAVDPNTPDEPKLI